MFMVKGIVNYKRVIKGISKIKVLLVFQGCQVVFLVLNEFIWHNLVGTYLNLLFCSYGHFLTFEIVMDSCMTEQDRHGTTLMHYVNKIGRIFFHTFAFVLLCLFFLSHSCTDEMYPFTFVLVGFFILSQQLFDLVFYWSDYLIDWENLPPQHTNGLWFNKTLFREQQKILFYTNLVFGTMSVITMWVGYKYVNDAATDPEKDTILICAEGNKWVSVGVWGSVFTTVI